MTCVSCSEAEHVMSVSMSYVHIHVELECPFVLLLVVYSTTTNWYL